MRPLLCGYYGEHNLGDDALLAALLAQLPPDQRPLVTAHDQAQVQARFGVDTCPRRRLTAVLSALSGCDALVLGGGSLLQDATSFLSLVYYALLIAAARLRGRPVLLWAQGLGPLHRRCSRLLVRLVLPLASGISWRDQASAALAARWGVRAATGSDPVWALPLGQWQGDGGPILLCWRFSPLLEEAQWRRLLEALDQLAEQADRPVHWLPFHQDQDAALLEELRRRDWLPPALARRSQTVMAGSPAEAMALFEGASLVIAMRLHALILAALSGAPSAALSYDPKVRAAADGFDCPCSDLDGPLQVGELLDQWQPLLDRPTDPARIETLRQATAVHRQLLLAGLPRSER
ncbi:polysaccharide pyruvyl transferase CsaB [Cyanobium sp. Morenito 9A2]|uniref:polysaccharide pyruvyl transferase CsaB n=1 Tax=Cyanobium sp. Morenito 9A2 TaxID=2823718 RepID=UPI0020CD770E|nr:polysaccharide pyruvyl transferase CsaB [Cyanobium sp. Morenito 9A2]MCP9850114.1 polysaccharide pyruvyl transferase CsaB [Cyanobium sp. Morenito 9A2]